MWMASSHATDPCTLCLAVTQVAIMTSDAKGNHERMAALLEQSGWFGRGRSAFRAFRQPMVPVMSVEAGEWLLSGELTPMMKPGGHGAIWKLMKVGMGQPGRW